MIEYPVLQELIEEVVAERMVAIRLQMKEQWQCESARWAIFGALKARFGPDTVPVNLAEQIRAVVHVRGLHPLIERAVLCQDIEAFRAALSS